MPSRHARGGSHRPVASSKQKQKNRTKKQDKFEKSITTRLFRARLCAAEKMGQASWVKPTDSSTWHIVPHVRDILHRKYGTYCTASTGHIVPQVRDIWCRKHRDTNREREASPCTYTHTYLRLDLTTPEHITYVHTCVST